MNPCRRTISPSCTKNSVRAIRFGNALRISQRPDPRLRTKGIPRGQRYWTVITSIPTVFLSCFCNPCNHSRTALAQFPFERRLRAKGGAPPDCIIFDTFSKQDLRLLTGQRLSGQPLARRLFRGSGWVLTFCTNTRAKVLRDGQGAWAKGEGPTRQSPAVSSAEYRRCHTVGLRWSCGSPRIANSQHLGYGALGSGVSGPGIRTAGCGVP